MQSSHESSQCMAIALAPDGIITSVSATLEPLTGYSAHELVGRPITVVFGDREAHEIAPMLKSALDWGAWDGEIVCCSRSGSKIRAHASLVPLVSRQNGCCGFLLILDVRHAAAGDQAGSPFREVAAYLRRTFHELNNPLAIIMGFTQLILLDPRCEGKTRTDVERVYTEMKRIVQIVEKLHAYALSLQEENSEVEKEARIG
jgi:PAS domain S-box-containing protein